MKLTIDREDLHEESRDKSCSKIGYNDLNDEAQAAVKLIGKATFQVCKFCGSPTEVDPSDQTAPADYCHEFDHRPS